MVHKYFSIRLCSRGAPTSFSWVRVSCDFECATKKIIKNKYNTKVELKFKNLHLCAIFGEKY